jgi:phosphomethylpyrimidine synthase
MHALIDQGRQGKTPWQVVSVVAAEGIDAELLCERVAEGGVVIMQRGKRCIGIGKGLCTKVNVNLGTSTSKVCVEDEIAKAHIAEQYGADTISDLSMGGLVRAQVLDPATAQQIVGLITGMGV